MDEIVDGESLKSFQVDFKRTGYFQIISVTLDVVRMGIKDSLIVFSNGLMYIGEFGFKHLGTHKESGYVYYYCVEELEPDGIF